VTHLRVQNKIGLFILLFAYNERKNSGLFNAILGKAGKGLWWKMGIVQEEEILSYFNGLLLKIYSLGGDNDLRKTDAERVLKIQQRNSKFFKGLSWIGDGKPQRIDPYLRLISDFDFSLIITNWHVMFIRRKTRIRLKENNQARIKSKVISWRRKRFIYFALPFFLADSLQLGYWGKQISEFIIWDWVLKIIGST